jgi:hypothetical protein
MCCGWWRGLDACINSAGNGMHNGEWKLVPGRAVMPLKCLPGWNDGSELWL